MAKQQTLRDTAVYSGIALHTGARSTLRFLPAPPDSGIVFRRIDLEGVDLSCIKTGFGFSFGGQGSVKTFYIDDVEYIAD